MKTIFRLLLAAVVLTSLTTCTKWYDDMTNFEEVLTNGAWVKVDGYSKPNMDTPYDTSSIGKLDLYDEEYVMFFYDNGIAKVYEELPHSNNDYVINKYSKDTLSNIDFNVFIIKWIFINDTLSYWYEDLHPVNNENIVENLKEFKIIEYSNNRIKYHYKSVVIYNHIDGVVGSYDDTLYFDIYYELKNVKNKYIIK